MKKQIFSDINHIFSMKIIYAAGGRAVGRLYGEGRLYGGGRSGGRSAIRRGSAIRRRWEVGRAAIRRAGGFTAERAAIRRTGGYYTADGRLYDGRVAIRWTGGYTADGRLYGGRAAILLNSNFVEILNRVV